MDANALKNAGGAANASAIITTAVDNKHPLITSISRNDADGSGTYTKDDTLTINLDEPVSSLVITDFALATLTQGVFVPNGHSLGAGATVIAVPNPNAPVGKAYSFEVKLGASPTIAVGDFLTLNKAKVADAAGNMPNIDLPISIPPIAARVGADVVRATLGAGETYDAGTAITLTGVQDLAGNSANLVFQF